MSTALLALFLAAAGANAAETTDLVVVFDTSGSMEEAPSAGPGRRKIDIAKEAMWGFLDALPRNVRVGLVAFRGLCDTTGTNVVDSTDENRDYLKRIVAGLRPEGKTPIGDGMERAVRILRPSKAARKRILVVTDGEETCDQAQFERSADEAWAAGIKVYAVGFDMGREPSANFRRLGIYKDATDAKELDAVFKDIRKSLEKGAAAYDEAAASAEDAPATSLAGRRGRFRPQGTDRAGKLFTTLQLNSSFEHRFGEADRFEVLEHGYHVLFDEKEFRADKVEVLRVRLEDRLNFVYGGVEGFVFVEDVVIER